MQLTIHIDAQKFCLLLRSALRKNRWRGQTRPRNGGRECGIAPGHLLLRDDRKDILLPFFTRLHTCLARRTGPEAFLHIPEERLRYLFAAITFQRNRAHLLQRYLVGISSKILLCLAECEVYHCTLLHCCCV